MIGVGTSSNDDEEFIRRFEALVFRLNSSIVPVEIYIVKIDHWFDFKWRDFEGKMLGEMGSWNSEELKIPPFIPDRVIEERFFERVSGKLQSAPKPDLHIYQSSSNNITGGRRIAAPNGPGLFFWYSGETRTTLRGSIMAYQISKESHRTFYISLMKKSGWHLLKTAGISRNEASSLLESNFA